MSPDANGLRPTQRDATRSWDVFLCYATVDKAIVAQLDRALTEAGLTVWWDQREVRAGDVVVQRIQEGLDRSRGIVLCLSDAMLASEWCGAEAHVAVHGAVARHKNVVPVVVGELDDSAIPVFIDIRRRVDGRTRDGRAELVAALRLHASAQPGTDARNHGSAITRPARGAPSRRELYRLILPVVAVLLLAAAVLVFPLPSGEPEAGTSTDARAHDWLPVTACDLMTSRATHAPELATATAACRDQLARARSRTDAEMVASGLRNLGLLRVQGHEALPAEVASQLVRAGYAVDDTLPRPSWGADPAFDALFPPWRDAREPTAERLAGERGDTTPVLVAANGLDVQTIRLVVDGARTTVFRTAPGARDRVDWLRAGFELDGGAHGEDARLTVTALLSVMEHGVVLWRDGPDKVVVSVWTRALERHAGFLPLHVVAESNLAKTVAAAVLLVRGARALSHGRFTEALAATHFAGRSDPSPDGSLRAWADRLLHEANRSLLADSGVRVPWFAGYRGRDFASDSSAGGEPQGDFSSVVPPARELTAADVGKRRLAASWLIEMLDATRPASSARRTVRAVLEQLLDTLTDSRLVAAGRAALLMEELRHLPRPVCDEPSDDRRAEIEEKVGRELRRSGDAGRIGLFEVSTATTGEQLLAATDRSLEARAGHLRRSIHMAAVRRAEDPSLRLAEADRRRILRALADILAAESRADFLRGRTGRDDARLLALATLPGDLDATSVGRVVDAVLRDTSGEARHTRRVQVLLLSVLVPQAPVAMMTMEGVDRFLHAGELLDAALHGYQLALGSDPQEQLTAVVLHAARAALGFFPLALRGPRGSIDGAWRTHLEAAIETADRLDVVSLAEGVPADRWPEWLSRQEEPPPDVDRDDRKARTAALEVFAREDQPWDPRPYAPMFRAGALLVDALLQLADGADREAIHGRIDTVHRLIDRAVPLYLTRGGWPELDQPVLTITAELVALLKGIGAEDAEFGPAVLTRLRLAADAFEAATPGLADAQAPAVLLALFDGALDLACGLMEHYVADDTRAARPRLQAAREKLSGLLELARQGPDVEETGEVLIDLGQAALEIVSALPQLTTSMGARARLAHVLGVLAPRLSHLQQLVSRHWPLEEVRQGMVVDDKFGFIVLFAIRELAHIGAQMTRQVAEPDPAKAIEQVEDLLEEAALELFRHEPPRSNRVVLAATIAGIATASERYDTADEWLQRAHQWAIGTAHESHRAAFVAARAHLFALKQRPGDVVRVADEFIAECPRLAWAMRPMRATARRALGDAAGAAADLDAYLEAVRAGGGGTISAQLSILYADRHLVVPLQVAFAFKGVPLGSKLNNFQVGFNLSSRDTAVTERIHWQFAEVVSHEVALANGLAVRAITAAADERRQESIATLAALGHHLEEMVATHGGGAGLASRLTRVHHGLMLWASMLARLRGLDEEAGVIETVGRLTAKLGSGDADLRSPFVEEVEALGAVPGHAGFDDLVQDAVTSGHGADWYEPWSLRLEQAPEPLVPRWSVAYRAAAEALQERELPRAAALLEEALEALGADEALGHATLRMLQGRLALDGNVSAGANMLLDAADLMSEAGNRRGAAVELLDVALRLGGGAVAHRLSKKGMAWLSEQPHYRSFLLGRALDRAWTEMRASRPERALEHGRAALERHEPTPCPVAAALEVSLRDLLVRAELERGDRSRARVLARSLASDLEHAYPESPAGRARATALLLELVATVLDSPPSAWESALPDFERRFIEKALGPKGRHERLLDELRPPVDPKSARREASELLEHAASSREWPSPWS